VRDALDDLLRRQTLVAIAAGFALGYALLDVARGAGTLVLSVFTERSFGSLSGGPLSLDVGGRTLEFGQVFAGLVTLAVVAAVVLYVLRGRSDD
jgi:hypothetical protein